MNVLIFTDVDKMVILKRGRKIMVYEIEANKEGTAEIVKELGMWQGRERKIEVTIRLL